MSAAASWSPATARSGAPIAQARWGWGEWGTVFGDPVVATAILDRLLHHSHVVTIRSDSYRLREKRRSGLIKAETLNQELTKTP
jgi:IstB-like ATP binding protein